MMRVSGRLTSCCAALLLALTSVSAVQRLNSINDLKRINFGQLVPKHTLLLLHWFANVVDIDENNIILLTFDPDAEDYGSHHYGNFEGMLENSPYSFGKYYTVGNLLLDTDKQLPDYVTNPRAAYQGRNSDRVIFRVRQQNRGWQTSRVVDQVYITQHYGIHGNTTYDPDHTYLITTNLLREIRQFTVGANQQPLSQLARRYGSDEIRWYIPQITNTWGDLACLGLLLHIVMQERFNFIEQCASSPNKTRSNTTIGSGVVRQSPLRQWNDPAPRTYNYPTQENDGISGTCVGIIILAVLVFVILSIIISLNQK